MAVPLFFGAILLLVVAVAAVFGRRGAGADKMVAIPADSERSCTTAFFTRRSPAGQTQYCVRDGQSPPKCRAFPLAAIVAANEASDCAQCTHITWGFGCDKGLLCGLQQAGPNLASYATADKIARTHCGSRRRLSC